MSSLTYILLIIASIAVLVTIADRLRDRLQKHVGGQKNSATFIKRTSANSFGQQSLGVLQMRGYGTLTLDNRMLHFVMLLPHREWHIPLSTILRIETPKSHLHKSQTVPLLKVVFTNSIGQEDSIAWRVSTLQEWVTAIENQRGK